MSGRKIKVACVQLRCGDDIAENVQAASTLIRAAHQDGAQFIATPENTGLMARDGGAKLGKSFAEEGDPALPRFRALAEELGIWLLVGSLAIKVADGKTANRSYLIGPKGRVAARYDKLHLFDVNLPSGETYRESNTVAPGGEAVVASLPWGQVGLSVCYDLRFPQLYRALAKSGAEILTVPSAFTETTGKAHWDTLVRARAIENLAYVVAPAQGGYHVNGRETHGHTMIVDPWGVVLDRLPRGSGVVVAGVNPTYQAKIRRSLPALTHKTVRQW